MLSGLLRKLPGSLGLAACLTTGGAADPASELDLEFADVGAAFTRATRHGALPVTPPTHDGAQTVAYVRDLNGMLVALRDQPRGA